ncbi:MAG: hypothetical protein HY744_10415 [Deltaproteobacteria bacterium]|nr:hypothetical protein [Deltaproteobacteria bacterium]
MVRRGSSKPSDPFKGLDVHRSPYRALVRVWVVCQDHAPLQRGLERSTVEQEANAFQRAIERGDPRPVVHPAAALRALDEYCAALGTVDLGPRQVEGYWVVRRPPGSRSSIAEKQPNHPEYWMRHHLLVPISHQGIRIEVRVPDDPGVRALAFPFEAATGGFDDGVKPDWNDPPPPYRCRRLVDADTRWCSVAGALVEAARREARIVVLPELTVDLDVLASIRQWLQRKNHGLVAVAAGSFHVVEDGGAGEPGKRRNLGWLLSGTGDILLEHRKLQPMRYGSRARPLDEDIEGGNELVLLAARCGLVALAICLDFCEIGGVPVASLWSAAGPSLVLVPSMEPSETQQTNKAHEARAKELRREHCTRVLVASQDVGCQNGQGLAWFDGDPGEARAQGWLWLTME